METKRFIGSDMARIYARVRNEFGPDAIIVETRSLLREGADPLIEVVAAPAGDASELPFGLQRALVDGARARVERPRRLVTIGDIEDFVERGAAEGRAASGRTDHFAPVPPEEEPAPDWLAGFVDAPPSPAAADPGGEGGLAVALDVAASLRRPAKFPVPRELPDAAPPSIEWATRPRPAIVTRQRPLPGGHPAGFEPPTAHAMDRGLEVGPGAAVVSELIAAGLTPAAASRVAANGGKGTASELAALFLQGRVASYPDESRTAVISIQGAAGSGRTTALMRMALDCVDAGREAVLLAADTSHVAGREQVHGYGEAIGLPVVDVFGPEDIRHSVLRARHGACLFADVPPGRWDAGPLPAIAQAHYLAVPAHWQGLALESSLGTLLEGRFAGAVLSFMDVVTDLSPALSLIITSDLGVAFLSSGRDVGSGIEVADPVTLVSGIFTTRTRESTDGRLVATA